MADLPEQLKELLPQYRIERELGGGGMSRIFLAEEVALARRVVLKTLPPELGAILSADRFQREVRLAASLQHPHIVTLLSAGQVGDILYYTMPYVEGESLRARLSREGELPVSEVLRILHEVVDALSYAHAQGVIHRDIKPDNVLESSRHAVITDFGIAKAVKEADEQSRLTGSGISIGTPAYMAPEQAAAEREIDARADIYAVGILAYELLTGEPPFRGPTAQAVIAAHMTRAPVPITDLRASVPVELAAIVARCLEKRPADRFQSSNDLLAALEAVGLSATGTAPTWPLPRVLGYFAVAAAGLLALAWGLRTLLGLPDWFFAAAVVLLALGLPIVVMAALAHNRRVSGGVTRAPERVPRSLTLRRAVTGGVAAFGALGVVTVGYMGMRAFGIGPVGTLVASGKINERERVILADFENTTADPRLGPAVTQAFRVDFSQSRLISPVESDYVRKVLQRMERPDTTTVTLLVARDVAQRLGFKAVVTGRLEPIGGKILVSGSVVNAASGEELASARATASDSTGIIDAVDQLSRKLREKIGESLRSIRANQPLADVTTPSIDALRLYSQAVTASDKGDEERGVALLQNALALDSTFAMAWRKLGTVLSNGGNQQASLASEALTRAFQLRNRLTFRERKLTETSYYVDVTGQLDSATAALQSVLAEYPDDSWALNNLGVIYEVMGNDAAAIAPYTRAAETEPENLLSWQNLFSLRIGMGQRDSAAAMLANIKQRFPNNPNKADLDVLFDLGTRDFVSAESRLRALLSASLDDPRRRIRYLTWLGGTLAIRGKLAESERVLTTLADLRTARGQGRAALEARIRTVFPIALYRDNRPAATARLDSLLREYPLEKLGERERPLRLVLEAAEAVGNVALAGRTLEEFNHNLGSVPGRAGTYLRASSKARVLAMRRESVPQALPIFREQSGRFDGAPDVEMAYAFDRAGMSDSALAHFRIWADAGEGLWENGIYAYWYPTVYFRMGELYEAKGDKVRAIDFYGRFTDLWREADPELQPRVKEAKRRIADLVAEPRH